MLKKLLRLLRGIIHWIIFLGVEGAMVWMVFSLDLVPGALLISELVGIKINPLYLILSLAEVVTWLLIVELDGGWEKKEFRFTTVSFFICLAIFVLSNMGVIDFVEMYSKTLLSLYPIILKPFIMIGLVYTMGLVIGLLCGKVSLRK